jgi:hypothetical protein
MRSAAMVWLPAIDFTWSDFLAPLMFRPNQWRYSCLTPIVRFLNSHATASFGNRMGISVRH